MINIYVDGGCRGNQTKENIGGIGLYCKLPDREIKLNKGFKNTTNNRMELEAIKLAFKFIDKSIKEVTIYSDSMLAVNTFNDWIHSWEKRGWRKTGNKPIQNLDLIKEIYDYFKSKPNVSLKHVRGHSGIHGNEMADRLANLAMDKMQ